MRFLCLSLASVIVASSAHAVFDLQTLSRFKSSAISRTKFTHVVAKAAGDGFYAAGEVADDVILVEFDAYGAVVRSTIWDTPQVQNEKVIGLQLYANGDIFLAAEEEDSYRFFIVKFTPNFTELWRNQVSGSGNRFAAIDANGTAFAIMGTRYYTYTSAGAFFSTVDFPEMEARAVKAYPAPTNGLVVVGRDPVNNRPRMLSLLSTLVPRFNQLVTLGNASASSALNGVDTDGAGGAVAVGRIGSSQALYTLANDVGLLGNFPITTANVSSLSNVRQISSQDILADNGSTLVKITRASGAVTATSGFGFGPIQARGEVLGSGRETVFANVTNGTSASVAHSNLASPAIISTSGSDFRAVAAFTSSVGPSLAAVGERFSDGSASVGISTGSTFSSTNLRFSAGQRRTLVDSTKFADGSIGMLAFEVGPDGGKHTFLRYRTNGTLAYAKTLPLAPAATQAAYGSMAVYADGSAVAAGSTTDGNVWFCSRISNVGALVYGRTILDFTGFVPQHTLANADGTTTVLGRDEQGRFTFVRLSATGQVTARTSMSHGVEELSEVVTPLVMPNGNLVSLLRFGSDAFHLVQTDGVTGAQVGTTVQLGSYTNGRLAGDGTDAVYTVLQATGNGILDKRSAANLNSAISFRSLTGQTSFGDVAVAPNGNILIVGNDGAGEKLFFYGPGSGHPTAAPTASFPGTIAKGLDIAIDSTNVAYVLAEEFAGGVSNLYSARYLANGTRSAQRRLAGNILPNSNLMAEVQTAGAGVWISGEVGNVRQGRGPFAARFSL